MTATATPISTATEQEHEYNDNQEQFHGISPLMAMALFAAPKHSTVSSKYCSRPTGSLPDLHCGDVSNSALSSPEFKHAVRGVRRTRMRSPDRTSMAAPAAQVRFQRALFGRDLSPTSRLAGVNPHLAEVGFIWVQNTMCCSESTAGLRAPFCFRRAGTIPPRPGHCLPRSVTTIGNETIKPIST
jgi:hypothetical protein